MLCHLSTFAGLIGVPFGNILGPLIAWMIKRDEYPLVDDQGNLINRSVLIPVVPPE